MEGTANRGPARFQRMIRPASIEEIGCGVARRDGGQRGVMALHACHVDSGQGVRQFV